MALQEYSRKRDFDKTPEPAPSRTKARGEGRSYLIQKHDATRLHYDFRLELDGVLVSWAVTKGPSLNPTDKRLAVRTEDHPVAYGTFEGTIPKGQYGGGTVMLWDRGSWEPKGDPHAGLKKGHLSFVLQGDRLQGGWDLVRMRGAGKRDNWLLIKQKDERARSSGAAEDFLDNLSYSVKSGRSMDQIAGGKAPESKTKPTLQRGGGLEKLMRRYAEVELATLVERPPEGIEWVHEVKFDGYRLLGFALDGEARLRTRNGKDWTDNFPSIKTALEKLKAEDAVMDMEAVALDAEGKSSFQALQAALGGGGNSQAIVAYVFDLVHLDGKDLTKLPLIERKEKLQAVLDKSKTAGRLRYSEHFTGSGAEMLAESCGMGLEGIVSKRADAPYATGRQKDWLKSKCSHRQEFIIIGYSDPRKGARALGALYLGYLKKGRMHYAGKVGTGFSMKGARELRQRFQALTVTKPVLTRTETSGLSAREWQSIHWAKPVLLCEVAFAEWTQDGQLRHPSFQGLREDKEATEVKREKPQAGAAVSTTGRLEKNGPVTLHGVGITHPDRVISEAGHITKGDLAEYYAAAGSFILPRISRHPISLLRCPAGIDSQCFFQRNPGKGLGSEVHSFAFKNKGKKFEYLYIEDEKGLMQLIQMGAIEIHPWGASVDTINCPDRLIFDLDPAPDVPFDALKIAARDLRQRLKRKKLDSFLKCTGGKGLHVTVPLAATDEWPSVKSFGAAVAEEMVAAAPDAYIATMSKAKRNGKIFIDYFRNDYTATAIGDYAVRARAGMPVAVPIEWEELESLESPSQFMMKDVLRRLDKKTPQPGSKKSQQTIPKPDS